MPQDPDSDSSDDDCFEDVGFMFDGALQKARRVFCFGDISVAVRLVDADPGAVQSGHYVWPAAPAMSAFLVHQRQSLPTGAVLELGAGCGLGGLVAAQLPGTTAVVFTDHDPGVLEIIGESIAEQAQASDSGWRAAAAKSRCVQLRWGRIGETQQLALKMALESISPSNDTVGREGGDVIGGEGKRDGVINGEGKGDDMIGGEGNSVFPVVGPGRRTDARRGRKAGDVSFDLVIGSDVIYSSTIVEPLFSTVDALLSRGFIPKQSKTASEVAGECRTDSRGGYAAAGASTFPSGFPVRPCLGPDSTDALGDNLKGNNTVTPPPLFIMSQSFQYDSDTEEAIDFACSEHGLEREIVWDNLQLAPTTARAHQDGREGFVDIEEGGSITGRGDSRRSEATGGCRLLSESTRAGTKLQLFRRSF